MKCKEVYLHICDNLDADLNSARCREILRHLGACPDCAAFLDSVRKTVTFYQSFPSPKVPRKAHRNLVHTISRAWGPSRKRRRRIAQ